MKKINSFKVFVLFSLFITFLNNYAAVPYVELVATDNKGMKFTIEVYESDHNQNGIDVIIYKNSDPSFKVYGTGTGIRNHYYVNTDTPLFDIAFANGNYKTIQPFKNILDIYYEKDDYFIAPKDTKDPGWRIPYVVYKKEGKVITPIEDSVENNPVNPQLQLSDFLTPNMEMKTMSQISQLLQKKGFSKTKDESNGITYFKKDNISIDYYLEEMENPKGTDCFNISFPTKEDAKKFISSISKENRWIPQTNYYGKTIGWKYNHTTISFDFDNFSNVGIYYDR